MPPFFDRFRQLSPAALVLAPMKQHIGCCVVLPALIKLAGGVALIQTLTRNAHAELVVVLVTLPLFIYLILKGEEAWKRRHTKRHAAAYDPCDTHCAADNSSFRQRYLVNLLIGLVLAYILHALFHHH